MGRTARRRSEFVLFIGLMCLARPVAAYSVLAHETVVDSARADVLQKTVASVRTLLARLNATN